MATIGNTQIKLLEKLCNAVSVSGDENEVRKIVLENVTPYVDEIDIDVLGNVLASRKGRGRRRLKVMLDAHMDEVGFMLVAEDGDGLYEFEIIGGIDARNLVGKQVMVGRDRLNGVIGAKPIHLAKKEELKRPITAEALRVDLGPSGKASIGDRGTFAPNFRRVGPSIMSKAIDDRIGVAILIELIKSAPPTIDILAAFTVQEEIGQRGARVAARYFEPDLAVVIDATPANDLPLQREGENTFYNTKLDHGPGIYVADPSMIDDRRLVDFFEQTATQAGIPFQLRQPGGGGTDAGTIQRTAEGIPVVSVSVPHRYSHSAISVVRLEDWKNTLALYHQALRRMTRSLVKSG